MTLITHNKKCNIKKNETQQTLESMLESVLQKQNKTKKVSMSLMVCFHVTHAHTYMATCAASWAYWVELTGCCGHLCYSNSCSLHLIDVEWSACWMLGQNQKPHAFPVLTSLTFWAERLMPFFQGSQNSIPAPKPLGNLGKGSLYKAPSQEQHWCLQGDLVVGLLYGGKCPYFKWYTWKCPPGGLVNTHGVSRPSIMCLG